MRLPLLRRRVNVLTVSVLLMIFPIASCGVEKNTDGSNFATSMGKSSDIIENKLISNVGDSDTDVKVETPITVTDLDGLDSVSLTNLKGIQINGSFNEDRTTWTSSEKLDYSTEYSLAARSGSDIIDQKFKSFTPAATINGALSPLDGSEVGIGQAIALRFDEIPVDRKAVQDAISVETNPKVNGAFYWISSQEVRWRPEEYWQPGTSVHVKASLQGTHLGSGTYGEKDREAIFSIGDNVQAEADDRTKTVTVRKNDKVIRTMPTSMGMRGRETPVGIYTIGDQYDELLFDSTTFGLSLDAGGYQSMVSYATQMSYSGIYLHSAPWSIWAQGNTNTSHGCLNLSPEDAKWVYDNMKRGDIVTVKNTGGEIIKGTDGLGDWNIPWQTWSQGNIEG